MTSSATETKTPTSILWTKTELQIIDQTTLPQQETWLSIQDLDTACEAICSLRVRGAPAIAVMAAYSLVVHLRQLPQMPFNVFIGEVRSSLDRLRNTRPTAVNLFHAMNRIEKLVNAFHDGLPQEGMVNQIQELAEEIHEEDRKLCDRLGKNASELIPQNARILTHCNTGALATGGIGTAFGGFLTAHRQGKNIRVFADETRPLLQGSRLTMWELMKSGIPATLITDSMAAQVMKKGIDLVMVGADRIARNGDTANKIGTYSVAVLAHYFQIPLYIVAPSTTLDPDITNGDLIPIEERQPDEIRHFGTSRTAPDQAEVYNPAFDVTPASLIIAIVTENGIHRPPYSF